MRAMRTMIKNARLVDGRQVDIETNDGVISSVTATSTASSATDDEIQDIDEIDGRGWLFLPAMAEPHAHLDKALTAERVPNPTGDLMGAIDAWVAASQAGLFTHDDMVARIRLALDKLLINGVTAVRSHINIGAASGIRHLLAAQEAVEPYGDLMDIEFVSLTHTPVVGPGSEANVAALEAAIEAGVHLIGGCPHLENDGPGSIRQVLELAVASGLPIDLHVDETLNVGMLTLRDLARSVIDTGHTSRVAASHCVSLGMQPAHVQREVAGLVAEAGIAIVPLPQTNLFLQGRDHQTATPRGLTALHALGEAGVLIAAGADNVQDPFNLVGRSDPLETAALLVMAGHILPDEAYDMVSNNVRRVLGLAPVTFEPGSPGDFVAINAPSVRGAIADAPFDRLVFHAGRLVASSLTTASIHR